MTGAGQRLVAGRAPGERIVTAIRTTASAGFTATETVTDTVTAALVAGRTYRVSARLLVGSTVAADSSRVTIREDSVSGTQMQQIRVYIPITSTVFPATLESEYTAVASGNKTFVATGQRASGTGTITHGAVATQPVYLYVDYIRG